MSQPDREVEPFFSQPIRQVTMMLVALALFGFGGYVAYPRVAPVFLSSPYLNGFILFVFTVGLIACVWQVVELVGAVRWIMAFTREGAVPGDRKPNRLLAPLAALMRQRGARVQISSSSSRSILESVTTRIEEARDITRYISNLLIFLGLLGTFYGLATTVPAVVETIRSLAPKDGEGATEIFGRLMTGLEAQLGGMGTAFASSLLGLAGSLIIGLLELFANHGQNRFYRELEEWLSSITRLGFASAEGEGGADTAVISAFAEHMSEQMDALQALLTNSDVNRSLADERLGQLIASVEKLTARLTEQIETRPAEDTAGPALTRVAEAQERLISVIEAQSEAQEAREARAEAERQADRDRAAEAMRDAGGPHVDAESRMRLRSIDVQLLRILEEMSAGRQESLTDLRTDLAALTKAIRQLGRIEGPTAAPPPIQARRG
ncbi:biopolymer transporter ExbB [Frigidibacter sp. ROC022]|uniref:biopolymer transporter ExbB n=1 Tax=Frigidibacter sp. ROC022 TaxID=2971796 RepID=UPI00215AEC37|nr:biopolymer transporter ExbB [Frigidibacter sp. ROC022]MCR8722921.1 biopolymer transporter ExbB [Frigidibacter sp. ROC022]